MKKTVFLSVLLVMTLTITTLYSSVASYKGPAKGIIFDNDIVEDVKDLNNFTSEELRSSGPSFVEYKDKRYRVTYGYNSETDPTDVYLGSGGYGGEPAGDYSLTSNGNCNVYTLKGFDPDYLICIMNDSGYVRLCPSFIGMSVTRGEDIYNELLGFNEKEFKLKYMCNNTYASKQNKYYTLPDTEGYKVRTLIRAMCDSPFVDIGTIGKDVINDYNKYYSLSFVTKNGVELRFAYTDNGYIFPVFMGIEYIQKLPDKVRDKVNGMLSANMTAINLRKVNEVYIGNNLRLLQNDSEISKYLPSYIPENSEYKIGFCTYKNNKIDSFRLQFNEGDNEQRPHFALEKISKEEAGVIPSNYHKTEQGKFDLKLIDIYTTEHIYINSKKEKEIDYFLDVAVEFEDCYILYSSSFISPEESYKILSSVEP